MLVSDEELERRRANWVCPPLKEEKGCLNIFAKMCRPAEEGGAAEGPPDEAPDGGERPGLPDQAAV